MAQIQKKIQKKSRSNTTCFFGCFGFPGDEVSDQMSPEKVGGFGKRKKSRWFSWRLKFRMKRPPSTKTVPVSDKPTQNHIHIEAPRASSKAKSDNLAAAASKRHPPMNSDQDIIEEPQQSRHLLDSLEDDTCQELERMLPTTRKLPCKKTGQRSHPGSPKSKFDSGPITAVISHPVRKSRQTQRGNASVVHPSKTTSKAVGKFDTVAVGMSIIMVTLVVMILWGRLCAILCTSAWLYFIPRLRPTKTTTIMVNAVKNQSNSKREVMDSNEYKKKVVMKGFLERNHRNSNNMMRIL